MRIYYAVLAFLCTFSLVAGMAALAIALLQVRKTARRIELLAEHLDDRVEALRGLGETVRHFSSTMRSGWVRGAELAFGLISALRRKSSDNSRSAHERESRKEASEKE